MVKIDVNLSLTIDEKGMALEAWYPMAMKLMKNAVPHTNRGNSRELSIICLIHSLP